MENYLFTGACTALVTPFLNGQINYPMLEILLRRQVAAGIPAVVICGTTGESAALSDKEKINLYHFSKEVVGNACLIIAGTGSNCTSHAVELSCCAEQEGADALLIVSPYYNKATDDGIIRHYLSIANQTSLPIILYNVPSRTGYDIPISAYTCLSRVPNIVGVKEASNDITKILKIRHACPKDFGIWIGNDEMVIPGIALGAQGVISVASNVYPEEVQAIATSALNSSMAPARDLFYRIQDFLSAMLCDVNPVPVKAAMQLIGYDCGECRLPLTHLSEQNQKLLKKVLQK